MGWSTKEQISRNISWDACFSPKLTFRHLATNASGCISFDSYCRDSSVND